MLDLYFSGQYYTECDPYMKKRLYSFFYHPCTKDLQHDRRVQSAVDRGDNVFLDSGAYSAYTQGVDIDLQQYIDYCLAQDASFHLMAALDVIGDAEASYTNYQRMKEQGVRALPVFHFGEPFDFLDTLVAESPVVGLGGVAQLKGGPGLYEWLDACWDHLILPDGTPKVEVHGFALTSLDVIKRYPWRYVDSTSWLFTGSMGRLVFLQNDILYNIAISKESPQQDDIKSRHWGNLNAAERDILHSFAEEAGTTIEECKQHPIPRGIFNIHTYKQFERYCPEKLGQRQDTLF